MNRPRLSLLLLCLILCVIPTLAFAQAGSTPAAQPPVTPYVAVIALLTMLGAWISHASSQGTAPKTWLPYLVLIGGPLGAVTANLTAAGVLTGTSLFWAAVAGGMTFFSGTSVVTAKAHFASFRAKPNAVVAAASMVSGLLLIVGCTPAAVASDIASGAQAAICVLNTYSADIAAGQGDAAAAVDAANKCNVAQTVANDVLSSHRKAEIVEGYVLRPAAPAPAGSSK